LLPPPGHRLKRQRRTFAFCKLIITPFVFSVFKEAALGAARLGRGYACFLDHLNHARSFRKVACDAEITKEETFVVAKRKALRGSQVFLARSQKQTALI